MTSAVFHKIVGRLQFDILKTIALNEELLLAQDIYGQTAISKIIINGGLECVPQELITEKVLFTTSKPEEESSESEDSDTTWSTLDCIIRADKYAWLPAKFRTENVMLKKQVGGWTGLHLSAAYGKLNQLERELITIKNLSIPTEHGANCYHLAAINGFIRQIPIDCLTSELLLNPDEEKMTPLGYVMDVSEDDLYYLPVDESCRTILGNKLDDILAVRRQKKELDQSSQTQVVELF